MLSGLSLQLLAQRQQVSDEIMTLRHYSAAQSALVWGAHQPWPGGDGWLCQREAASDLQACLYRFSAQEALMAAFQVTANRAGQLILWRWGRLERGGFIPSRHGWLDYCPLPDKTQCQPGR